MRRCLLVSFFSLFLSSSAAAQISTGSIRVYNRLREVVTFSVDGNTLGTVKPRRAKTFKKITAGWRKLKAITASGLVYEKEKLLYIRDRYSWRIKRRFGKLRVVNKWRRSVQVYVDGRKRRYVPGRGRRTIWRVPAGMRKFTAKRGRKVITEATLTIKPRKTTL